MCIRDRGIAVLSLFSVDEAADVQILHVRDFIGRDDAGTCGAESVQTLSQIPLFKMCIRDRYWA